MKSLRHPAALKVQFNSFHVSIGWSFYYWIFVLSHFLFIAIETEPKRSRHEKAPTRPVGRRENNLYGCQRTYSLFIESNWLWWLKCRISLILHVTHDDDILSRTSSHYALERETRPINLSITFPPSSRRQILLVSFRTFIWARINSISSS